MNEDKVLELAKLARIDIDETEAASLSHEFEAILGYVGEVKSASRKAGAIDHEEFPVKNILREDKDPHESGIHTEKILEQAPFREGDYLKVKNIL